MYGGATKPESYCKISVYLQHNVNLLYDNVESLCLFGNFTPRGKGNGVTFIVPDDARLKEIDALVGTDPKAAVDMIRAYTIPMYLEDINAFNVVGGITNNNGDKLTFVVNGKTATAGDLTVTTLNPIFKVLYADSKINVFQGKGKMSHSSKNGSTRVSVGNNNKRGGGDCMDNNTPKHMTVSSMFNVVKACIEACMPVDNADPLTHLTLSLYNSSNSSNSSNNAGKKSILSTFMSPTDSLFFMALFKDEGVGEYYMGRNSSWSDSGVVNSITTNKGGSEYYAKMWDEKMIYIKTNLASDTLIKQVVDIHTGAAKHVMQRDGTASLFDHGEKGLANFLLIKNEFAQIYGTSYAEAYKAKDSATIRRIFHVFHNLYLPHILSQEFDKARQLTDEGIAKKMTGDVAYFCAVLSFYVNVFCGGVGVYGGVDSMVAFPNTVEYNTQMKPNNVQQTSSLKPVADMLKKFK